jgi:hypothetical protein
MISEKSMPSGLTRGWEPVLGKDHAPQNLERDGDSQKSHPVLVAGWGAGATRAICSGVLEALGHHPAALGKLLHDLLVQPDVHFC